MLDSFDGPWKPDRKPPRPVLLYYDQGIYGDADCTVRFLTNFYREFGRIELQFIGIHPLYRPVKPRNDHFNLNPWENTYSFARFYSV